MKTSRRGIDFIKQWEAFRAHAYLDQKGIWTIGYGRITNVKPGDTITEAEAEKDLLVHIRRCEITIRARVAVELNQNQFDALVSLIYNIGVGAFRASTLLKKLNKKDFKGASAEFARWNKLRIDDQIIVSKGLTNRRNAEIKLFNEEVKGTIEEKGTC